MNKYFKIVPFLIILAILLPEILGIVFFKYVKIEYPIKNLVAMKLPTKEPMQPFVKPITNIPIKKYNKIDVSGISAKGVLVQRMEDNLVLYERNSKEKFYIASIAKLITAITARSNFNNNKIIHVDQIATSVGGSSIELPIDTDFSVKDLLYALLLPSSNQAAYAFGSNLGDKNFIDKMNKIGSVLDLKNSFFINPAGFDDEIVEGQDKKTNQSTAEDVAKFTKYFMQDELFREIVSTKEKIVSTPDGKTIKLKNTNDLLGRPGITGVKTGTENLAGQCLVITYERNSETFIIVLLHSEDRFLDAQKIIEKINQL